MRGLIAALSLSLLLVAPGWAQNLKLQVESREIYAGLPFTLSLAAQGFEEEPSPQPPDLAIEGCEITYLGVSPSVSSRIQIINGRRSEWRDVTFVYRWRVEAPKAGSYRVPALTISQDGRSASSPAASFVAKSIETTRDMMVRMVLPERPVWIGETFDVAVEWLLRRDVGDHDFVVPLFDVDGVQIESPATGRERTLKIPAGAREIELPIRQDQVTEGGVRYTRFRFPARVTVNRAGPVELDPVMVAASLETGTRRDTFGFRTPSYQLYKAEGQPRRLIVRPLPREGRPDSFENAIGSAFSIDVQASRTVVQVGDPIQLKIRIRGDGPLEGLSLPRLNRSGGLPPELFSVSDSVAVGVIDDAENAKTFDVTARIRSAEAREIPPIEFSYFDPVRGEYGTVRSQPVALSVAGGNLVDAADVTVAPPTAATTSPSSPAGSTAVPSGGNALASLIGADMSLSPPRGTLQVAWVAGDLSPLLLALYLLPMAIVIVRVWLARTRQRRGHARRIRQAMRALERTLESAAPAREAAPQVINAMRALARLTGRDGAVAAPVLEQLETRAFDPAATEGPLDEALAREVRSLARQWVRSAEETAAAPSTASATAGLIGLALFAGAWAPNAQGESETTLDQARALYQAAMNEDDRVRRTRLFADAERLFRSVAAEHSRSPEVLTDWGNAALGAQDLGRAVLAYRRALEVEPTHERARSNLDWLRDRAPVWLPRPSGRGALDSLFFWHHKLSIPQRHLIGAAAFAIGLLLLAPWPPVRRTRLLRRLAVPMLIVWLAATGSALLSGNGSRDAVVVSDGAVLRSADSLGAPPAFGNPLPAGTELSILESRNAWMRVALFDGTRGWMASSAVEEVVP